jgi:hypothetical protein
VAESLTYAGGECERLAVPFSDDRRAFCDARQRSGMSDKDLLGIVLALVVVMMFVTGIVLAV